MSRENGKMKRTRPSQYPHAQPLLAFSLAVFSACEARAVDFATDIAPIFAQHCICCHSQGIREGDISLATIADLNANEYVTAADAAGSYLIELVTGTDGEPVRAFCRQCGNCDQAKPNAPHWPTVGHIFIPTRQPTNEELSHDDTTQARRSHSPDFDDR